jgi:hypothetical protein
MLIIGLGTAGKSLLGSNFELVFERIDVALWVSERFLSSGGMLWSDHRDLRIFSPMVGVAATAVGGTDG